MIPSSRGGRKITSAPSTQKSCSFFRRNDTERQRRGKDYLRTEYAKKLFLFPQERYRAAEEGERLPLHRVRIKKGGERANSPPEVHAACVPAGNLPPARGSRRQHRKSKKLRQWIHCRSRFSASKAAGSPYLQRPADNPSFSSYPDFASLQLPHRLLRYASNDRLSPCAAASSLTVAVPFGICTRFPILSGSPSGSQSTKLAIYFRQ